MGCRYPRDYGRTQSRHIHVVVVGGGCGGGGSGSAVSFSGEGVGGGGRYTSTFKQGDSGVTGTTETVAMVSGINIEDFTHKKKKLFSYIVKV